VPEAASYLGVSYWTCRDLVNYGTVPAVRLPNPRARDGRTVRRILVDRADLDRLIGTWKESA
jgi:excisionase family DNA binding protein